MYTTRQDAAHDLTRMTSRLRRLFPHLSRVEARWIAVRMLMAAMLEGEVSAS